MNFSIRKRLLFLLLSTLCVAWGLVTWQVYVSTQHEVEELFDANLAQNARVLLALIQHEIAEHHEDEDEHEEEIEFEVYSHSGHKYEHKLAFLIRANHGNILIRSAKAPLFPKPHHHLKKYTDYEDQGDWWRVFTLKSKLLTVQTAERYDIREELIGEILSSTLIVLLITLPLFAFLIWLIVGTSFKALQNMTHDISKRTSEQLHPIEIKKIPLEIKPLIKALNELFSRLSRAFENERRFTADAAHELRTPLAGLKTQAQVAQRATEVEQREQALQKILIGVDRTTHLVTQLLSLARIESSQKLPTSPIRLDDLIAQLINEQMPQALEKQIDLGLENRAHFQVIQGNQDALFVMMRNLIDNAIRYTPTGGQVTISLENPQPSQIRVRINDTGPGIPPEQDHIIFERFYRGKHQAIQGSGLGLSIAKKVAQLHQTEIQLTHVQPHGLSVEIRFFSTQSTQRFTEVHRESRF
jgi:two-component system, OmpR family, sensor histidine kinase QseC